MLRNLTKKFNDFTAVDNMNIDMLNNNITILLGKNGAGKTTLLRMLTGLYKITSGSGTINNYDLETEMDKIRSVLSYTPQHNVLYKNMTVMEHLLFYGELKDGRADSKLKLLSLKKHANELLQKVHLVSKKNALTKNLSGGQKRKLQLAISFIGKVSEVIIIDEASSGVDSLARRQIWELLLEQKKKKNKTIIITTHYLDEAEVLGDKIAIMNNGRLKCFGSSLFLQRHYKKHSLDAIFLQVTKNDEAEKITATETEKNRKSTTPTSNNNNNNNDDTIETEKSELTNEKIQLASIPTQIKWLLRKRLLYSKRDYRTFICNVIFPIILFGMGLLLLKFVPFLQDQPSVFLSIDDYNTDFDEQELFVPFAEYNRFEQATTNILDVDTMMLVDNTIKAENIGTLLENEDFLEKGDVEGVKVVYGIEYFNGLVYDPYVAAVSAINLDIDEFTGTNILETSWAMLVDSYYRNTPQSVYGGVIFEDKQVQLGRRCQVSSLNTFSSVSTLCGDPQDSCLSAEIANLDPNLFIPALIPAPPEGVTLPTSVNLCVPLGCYSEMVEHFLRYNESTIEEAFDALFETNIFTFLRGSVDITPKKFYQCSGKSDCNDFPPLSALLSGESVCRGEGGTCVDVNSYLPLALDYTIDEYEDETDIFVPDDALPPCEAFRRRDLQQEVPEVLQNCSSLPAVNCTLAETCSFLPQILQCAVDCEQFSMSKALCQSVVDEDLVGFFQENESPCTFNIQSDKCVPSCSLAGSDENLCNDIDWIGSDCEFVNNSCITKHRYKYTLLVNTTSRHAAPVYANMMNNILLKKKLAFENAPTLMNSTIKVRTHPLPRTLNEEVIINGILAFNAAIFTVISQIFPSAASVGFIVYERSTSTHQQHISGVSYFAYWSSTFLFDMLIFLLPCFSSIGLIYLFNIEPFIEDGGILAVTTVLLLYGFASFNMAYCLTFLYPNKHTVAINLQLMFNLIFGLILMIASYVMSLLEATKEIQADYLVFIFRLFPGYCLGESLQNLAIQNIISALSGGVTSDNADDEEENADGYKAFELDITGYNIIYLAGSGVFWFILAIIIQYVVSYPYFSRTVESSKKEVEFMKGTNNTIESDEDVVKEQERIDAGFDAKKDYLVLQNLRKVYKTNSKLKTKTAVKKISIGFQRGRVYGILGHNGAGKSSTFSMITQATFPSKGDIFINNISSRKNPQQVSKMIGYCPQQNPLLDKLTVYEHLQFYANIRGIKDTENAIETKMKELELLQYKSTISSSLSGGNKRKLCVAIATIGDPPIVLLDEPSSGVDIANKLFLWDVIKKMASDHRQTLVLLTSHSLEEIENCCDAITIMVDGELKCFGEVEYIKNKYSKGITIQIKLEMKLNKLEAMKQNIIEGLAAYRQKNKDTIGGDEDNNNDTIMSLEEFKIALHCIDKSESYDALSYVFVDETLSIDYFLHFVHIHFQRKEFMKNINELFNNEKLTLVDHHDLIYNFNLEDSNKSINDIKSVLEKNKDALELYHYQVHPTTLEIIFNSFSSHSEENNVMN